jgi:hypothetical protein
MAAPTSTPKPAKGSNRGCLMFAIGLPLVMLVGLAVGTALNRPDDPNDTARVTVDEGTIGDTDWEVTAERDVEGAACAFLYEDGGEDPLTGACSLTPQDATFGEETVVFGRAGSDKAEVEVALSDGSTITIPTEVVGDVEGRFYAVVVPGDVDAEGFASATGG